MACSKPSAAKGYRITGARDKSKGSKHIRAISSSNDRSYGCMSLIYIASALTVAEVESWLLPPLRDMTMELSRALQTKNFQKPSSPAKRRAT